MSVYDRGLSRQRHDISTPVEVFEDRTLLASTPVLNITSPPPSNVDEGNSISVAGTVTQTGSENINVYIRWDDDGATGSSSPWYSDSVQVPPGNSFRFSNQYRDDGQLTVTLWASVVEYIYNYNTQTTSSTGSNTGTTGSTTGTMTGTTGTTGTVTSTTGTMTGTTVHDLPAKLKQTQGAGRCEFARPDGGFLRQQPGQWQQPLRQKSARPSGRRRFPTRSTPPVRSTEPAATLQSLRQHAPATGDRRRQFRLQLRHSHRPRISGLSFDFWRSTTVRFRRSALQFRLLIDDDWSDSLLNADRCARPDDDQGSHCFRSHG